MQSKRVEKRNLHPIRPKVAWANPKSTGLTINFRTDTRCTDRDKSKVLRKTLGGRDNLWTERSEQLLQLLGSGLNCRKIQDGAFIAIQFANMDVEENVVSTAKQAA